MKTFVYKLRPTAPQEASLLETLETCRILYNRSLEERREAWGKERRRVGLAEQSASLPGQKKTNPYLSRVYSQTLQSTLRRVDHAFQAFFRRCKSGGKPGYPRFKGRGQFDSFCYPQWGNGGARFSNGRIALSKIGHIRIHSDRPLQGTPKTCTIRRRADGWYASIVCDVEPVPLPATGESVGIDVGLEAFATLSTGERIENPRFLKRSLNRLRVTQRRLTRRKKGGAGRRKARVLLAKAHLKIRRQRLDFAHKAALALVRRFDTLAVEKLNIRGMVRNHPLARSISDAGWGIFLSVLRNKAESAGRRVVEVDPAGTSQRCSGCGETVPKKLSDRWHSCPRCGCSLHRDHNAALNIEKAGAPPLVANVMGCHAR